LPFSAGLHEKEAGVFVYRYLAAEQAEIAESLNRLNELCELRTLRLIQETDDGN
jgi:hypothetical protein